MDKTLAITGKGKETLAKLWPVVENTEVGIPADCSAEERRILHKQLRLIQEKCLQIIGDG